MICTDGSRAEGKWDKDIAVWNWLRTLCGNLSAIFEASFSPPRRLLQNPLFTDCTCVLSISVCHFDTTRPSPYLAIPRCYTSVTYPPFYHSTRQSHSHGWQNGYLCELDRATSQPRSAKSLSGVTPQASPPEFGPKRAARLGYTSQHRNPATESRHCTAREKGFP